MRDSHVSTHHSPSPQLQREEHPRKGMGVTLLEPASASPLQNYRRYSETTDFRLSPPLGPKAKAPYATLTFPTAGSTNPVSHLDNSINYTIIDFCLTEGLRKTKEDREEEKKKRIEKERREEDSLRSFSILFFFSFLLQLPGVNSPDSPDPLSPKAPWLP